MNRRIDLRYNDRWWIPVDFEAEPEDWVPGVVRARWEEDELPANEQVLNGVVQSVTTVVEAVLVADPPAFLCLLLQLSATDGIAAIAAVRIEDLDEPIGIDEVLEDLLLPDEMLEVPAQVTEVDTRGGRAVRVLQRCRIPESPGVESVSESLVYVWLTTDDDGLPLILTFSTMLDDLVEAEEIRPLFDEVAVTIAVVED